MSTALIALVGTLFGGVGLKIVELIWTRFQQGRLERQAADQRIQMRAQEIQDRQLESLTETLRVAQDSLRVAETEVDRWRKDYFTVREEHVRQLAELQAALYKIKELENERANRIQE